MALLLACPAVHAARPFVTDDARLTTAQSCQLESWMRVSSKSSELWALPACNLGGNFEITAGGGRARFDNAPSTEDYVFQAKTLFKTLEDHGYGLGLAVGKVLHPGVNPGPNLLGSTYAYVPATLSFLDGRALLHSNLGWLHDKATQRDNLTWGVGSEFAMTRRFSVMAESFGDNRATPYWQAGLRAFLIPDRVQIDGTVGQQWNGEKESRWFSIGLRFTPDRLF